ncbi:RNA polymerase sigma factor SigZ [Vibrio marisflavi]|nr:RNA polymerase sigma factor SigZ [Vibrio marisflavi]
MNIESIWSKYQSNLRHFLHRHIATPSDVDDLLQEVLIKSHKSIHTLKDHSKIKPWLFQIARNTIIDFYRKRTSLEANISAEDWLSMTPSVESELRKELAECIRPFINRLPDENAALLLAIELDGVSQKDYADKMGVNYSTIKSRMQKSRKLLYEVFQSCCDFEVNKQGNIVDYKNKKKGCSEC